MKREEFPMDGIRVKKRGTGKKRILIFAGRTNPDLVRETARRLGGKVGRCRLENFPDGELQVEIQDEVRSRDVYLFQSIVPPAGSSLLELLFLSDACRRGGAGRLTAVIPYCGYARQDHRTGPGEPLSARVIADLLATRFDRILAVDLHSESLEGFFPVPLENVSAVPLLAKALRPYRNSRTVIVAPDLGAVKLAQRYADLLHLPVVYVHKTRLSGGSVRPRPVRMNPFGSLDTHLIGRRAVNEISKTAVPSQGGREQVRECRTPSRLKKPRRWKMARPIVDQDTCTGCGACVDLCPEVFELRGDKAQAAEGGIGRRFYMIKEDPR